MKEAFFVYLGRFIQEGAQLHVWLYIDKDHANLSTETISRASAEIYNTMIHDLRIQKNDHVLVLHWNSGIVHSTQIFHITFQKLTIPPSSLPIIWQRMKAAKREPPYYSIMMKFKEDDETVDCCLYLQEEKLDFDLPVKLIMNLRVDSYATTEQYASLKQIPYPH